MRVQVIHELRVQVETGFSAKDAVVAVRVDVHVERFVGLHEGFRQFIRVLHVHVVVRRSVAQQQVPFQFVGPLNG